MGRRRETNAKVKIREGGKERTMSKQGDCKTFEGARARFYKILDRLLSRLYYRTEVNSIHVQIEGYGSGNGRISAIFPLPPAGNFSAWNYWEFNNEISQIRVYANHIELWVFWE